MSGSSSEFLSEAQDIVENFSRDLLLLEGQLRDDGDFVPDILNSAFRSIHTLKGLAALTGRKGIVELSDTLESCLDGVRLGRRTLDQDVLDICFECVEAYEILLASVAEDSGPVYDTGPLNSRLNAMVGDSGTPRDEAADLTWLDPSVASVLTEYECHRLGENIRKGRGIFRVHTTLELLSIDVGLEALKEKIQEDGEIVTYLPSADAQSEDKIEIDVLVGTVLEHEHLVARLGDSDVQVALLHLPKARKQPAPVEKRSRAGADRITEPEYNERQTLSDPPPGTNPSSEPELKPNDISLRSLSQTVRVDLRRLDSLMNLVGELSLVEANLVGVVDGLRGEGFSVDASRELQDQLRLMNRKLTLLQQGILEVRMVPLGQVFDKLARIVRKIGREASKDVQLHISGAETELDKRIVEELSDPLMHMIRNAIDHGIEGREERIASGKEPRGKIDLRAYQKGNRVVIEIQDDGRGIDWKRIRDTAIRKGLITEQEAAELSPEQATNLIFSPGFSTRETADLISGRGVGMDVVNTNISRLSGMIDIQSQVGSGTRFLITLPVTLAIIQALVIETAGQTFCIPLNSVLESIMVTDDDIMTVEGHAVVSLRGRTLPLVDLGRMFELERRGPRDQEYTYIVVVGLAHHRVGLVVDELLGQQDVVIKSLGKALRQIPGVAGATELDANRTVLLLDVGPIVAEALNEQLESSSSGITHVG